MKKTLLGLLIIMPLSWARADETPRVGVAKFYTSRDATTALVISGDAARAQYESLTKAKELPNMGDESWDATQRLGDHISCTKARQRRGGAKTEYECLIKFNNRGQAQKAIPG